MRVVYVHGYGSQFDPESPKINALAELGPVTGPRLDYIKDTAERNITAAMSHCVDVYAPADLVVGTSLGGWIAAEVGYRLGIPFVACNPAIAPYRSLVRYDLPAHIVHSYTDMNLKGAGLVLVDKGDTVLDPYRAVSYAQGDLMVVQFEGGSHRFEHMKESVGYIDRFYHTVETSLGV